MIVSTKVQVAVGDLLVEGSEESASGQYRPDLAVVGLVVPVRVEDGAEDLAPGHVVMAVELPLETEFLPLEAAFFRGQIRVVGLGLMSCRYLWADQSWGALLWSLL